MRRVLLVDDDAMTRQVLALVLGEAGWDVVEAHSGDAAVALAEEGFGAVLTDLQMPGVSGSPLAEALHAAMPGVPVVAMTATRHEAGVPAGYAALLLKPFDAEAFEVALAGITVPDRSDEGNLLDEATYQRFLQTMGAAQTASLYSFALDDAEQRLAVLRAAKTETEFRAVAHALKGAAAMVGATELKKLAETLETGMNAQEKAVSLEESARVVISLRSILSRREQS